MTNIGSIINYFKDPKNHLDRDTKHISKEEFKSAIGKVSKEADEFLAQVVYSTDGYANLTKLQTEGFINDREVSLRDLYAYQRGTGHDGERINTSIFEEPFCKDGVCYIASSFSYDGDEKVSHGILAKNTEIDGRTYQAGSKVRLHMGHVSEGTLAKNTEIKGSGGVIFRGGTTIEVTEAGWTFGTIDKEIDGFPFPAGSEISIGHDDFTGAQLFSWHITKDTKIGEYIYQGGTAVVFDRKDKHIVHGTLAKGREFSGVMFSAGSDLLFSKGKLVSVYSDKKVVINGNSVKNISVHFKEGRISGFSLNEEGELNGVKFPYETEGVIEKDGLIAITVDLYKLHKNYSGTLTKDTKINGVVYKGGSKITLDHGNIEGTLAKNTEIHGIPCQAGSKVCLYWGTVSEGTLAKNYTEKSGVTFRGGTTIEVNSNGWIIGTIDKKIDGFPFPAGSEISIGHDDFTGAQLFSWYITKDIKIGEYIYQGGTEVVFDRKDKHIVHGRLAKDSIFSGAMFSAGSTLLFSKGKLVTIYSNKEVVINGNSIKEVNVYFKEGRISGFCSYKEVEINGVKFPANTEVVIEKNGLIAVNISFSQLGQRSYTGTLTKATKINGVVYKSGSKITYDFLGISKKL